MGFVEESCNEWGDFLESFCEEIEETLGIGLGAELGEDFIAWWDVSLEGLLMEVDGFDIVDEKKCDGDGEEGWEFHFVVWIFLFCFNIYKNQTTFRLNTVNNN